MRHSSRPFLAFLAACCIFSGTPHLAPTGHTGPSNPAPPSGGKTTPPTDNSNILLGNPSNASTSLDSFNNFLYDHGFYVESYNRDRNEPNWVSWYVGDTSLGSE